jgi:hypothetical protein
MALPIANMGASNIKMDLLVKSLDSYKYKLVHLVIIYNAPLIKSNENIAASLVVNQGEEIGNVAMSFESSTGEAVSVETLITLDGVKVNKVDTSKAGVYNIRQIATDSIGRQTRVSKEIVVQEVSQVKEEVVQEVIEQPVILPVEVVTPVQEEVKVQERVELHTQHVEMHLDNNKAKIRGYKKRKEIKKAKKESFTFKLFSKYFFKIYDG